MLLGKKKRDQTATPTSELRSAIEALKTNPNSKSNARLAAALKTLSEQSVWVHIGGEDTPQGFSLKLINNRGKMFVTMYTDGSEIKGSAKDVMVTDFNKLLDTVYSNVRIAGIAIDPDTLGFCLDKGFLLKSLLHYGYSGTDNGGSPQRNWGKGIPKYRDSDVMSVGELRNFAMHAILEHDKDIAAFQVISACDHADVVPNIIFNDRGHFIFVAVNGYCAMEEPVLNSDQRTKLLALGQKYNASCYYAPVGFGSTDPERFEACLALRGDGFYCRYLGLQEVN